MNLFIIKKVIVIYQNVIKLSLFFFLKTVAAQDDIFTYCFEGSTNVQLVKTEMEFLLLPREKVSLRPQDRCIDIVTTFDRSKLLEKFLRKRYALVSEPEALGIKPLAEHCRIEFKSIKERKVDTKNLTIGNTNQVNALQNKGEEVSISEMLLAVGRPGNIDVDGRNLNLECTRGASGIYQIIFSFKEQTLTGKNQLSSQVSLKAQEVLNLASVVKDLNEKNNIVGIPQTSLNEKTGIEKTRYELKILEEN